MDGQGKSISVPEEIQLDILSGNTPVVEADNSLRFPSCSFSPEAFGLIHSATDLINIWTRFVLSGFPLEDILSLLKFDEPIEIVRTIDALECCHSIKGVEERVGNLKKNLSSILKQKNSKPDEKKESILRALTSTTDELRIAYMVSKMGYPLEFREMKGPDFLIQDEGTKLLEAKSRFNRTYFGGKTDKTAKLTEKGIFSLLCRDAFPLLNRAFGDQNTHIALVNLSHSEYGLLLAMHSLVNDKKFDLKRALADALMFSRNGTDAVVLYVESSGGTSEHFGVTIPKKTVEDIGRSLDAIENILKKTGQPFDFYDVAHIAENADDWIRDVK